MKTIICLVFLAASLVSCKKSNSPETSPPKTDKSPFELNEHLNDWQPFYSDYPPGSEAFYELEFSHAYLPAPLNQTVKAIKVSGNNHSADLLLFIARKFDKLLPNTVYAVTFNVDLASYVTIDAPGIGSSPDLALGVGGTGNKPEHRVVENHYRPNFVSRVQSSISNEVMKVIGRIGVSLDVPALYTLINRNNLGDPISIRTNDKGELWLMVGTDSGFEGTTTLYYTSIDVTINPSTLQ